MRMRSSVKSILAAALLLTAAFSRQALASTPTDSMATQTEGPLVEIATTAGNITVRLYDDTPRHRDNFLKLVSEKFYDGVLFHRVVDNFVIQAGDPDSRNALPGRMLGGGDAPYKLEAEIRIPERFHKRGALAAAREPDDVNPQKMSSGAQFYIVTGRVFKEGQLRAEERQTNLRIEQEALDSLTREHRDSIMSLRRARNFTALRELQDELTMKAEEIASQHRFRFTDSQREAYTTAGGVPHLDGDYTVFGEVVSGMDVVEKIEKEPVDANQRPVNDVRITGMRVLDDGR